MPLRIEDYALLGDCETAALVGRDGSIDWLCWPRFDSGACFAALLGGPEHGRWLLAPADPSARVSRRYHDDTLILETRFETAEGAVLIQDFMPVRGRNSDLVRIVRGVQGRVTMHTEITLRFDYGLTVPWVTHEGEDLVAIAGPNRVTLRTPVRLQGWDLRTVGTFEVAAGQSVPFVLTYGASHGPPPAPVDPEAALAETRTFWKGWIDRCTYRGRWAPAVRRSLITLKALTHAPTGGIVAAVTTSLPEQLGGARNWDYRYCWLRDSTFTLLALMDAGFHEEARTWRDWLMRTVAGAPDQMQIMYGVGGERLLPEWEAHWLPGYEGSQPVRIGNGAAGQVQIDVHGEVADAMLQSLTHGMPASEEGWAVARVLMAHLEGIWREPDAGIWEVRGGSQHFVHSKVMAWVAFDRAIRGAEMHDNAELIERWRGVRDEIHAEVCSRGFDAEGGTFVQAFGSRHVDASLLLLPLVGFLPPEDPRIRGTVRAVESRLLRDGLVRRYDTGETDDGLPPGEGAFLACSFWLADNYVLQGRTAEARALMERLVGLSNDVGLLAEEYDTALGRQLGNFPQAFSHVALVNTALNLTRSLGPAGERAG
ncbi:glycoside hydrolase family 15 protein [Arenibaculum pallidiluteum]|uniref:glycoside hydrolase family 15 protein n=1 Tax=Arenibaculum pallidiluteum TaxID=2812559 RepID=UPI001A95E0E7|nr:glycoside hydrolase family 15 protein [Arenibaculum pallidiluteum]